MDKFKTSEDCPTPLMCEEGRGCRGTCLRPVVEEAPTPPTLAPSRGIYGVGFNKEGGGFAELRVNGRTYAAVVGRPTPGMARPPGVRPSVWGVERVARATDDHGVSWCAAHRVWHGGSGKGVVGQMTSTWVCQGCGATIDRRTGGFPPGRSMRGVRAQGMGGNGGQGTVVQGHVAKHGESMDVPTRVHRGNMVECGGSHGVDVRVPTPRAVVHTGVGRHTGTIAGAEMSEERRVPWPERYDVWLGRIERPRIGR